MCATVGVSGDAKSDQCFTFLILLDFPTTFDTHDNSLPLEVLFSLRSHGNTLS